MPGKGKRPRRIEEDCPKCGSKAWEFCVNYKKQNKAACPLVDGGESSDKSRRKGREATASFLPLDLFEELEQ